MLQITNLTKSFGSQLLFDSVNLKINSGEKVGLVGRNGEGKTTLLKILIGTEHPDDGSVDLPKNYRFGFVKQNIKFSCKTVLEEACSELPEHEKESVWKVEKILSGLGFEEEDFKKSPTLFSGGFQVRINLAKVLASEPDMLLLDEPTNYLDIVSIQWLTYFLKLWDKELIIVTHDRSFMDNIVTHTAVLHRSKIRKIEGNTSKAYEQIAKEEEIYEKTRINDEKKRKDMEQYISRFRAKARLAGLVQSRIKTLEKMSQKEKLSQLQDLDFYFNYEQFDAKVPLQAEKLSFGYTEDNLLIDDFSITIGKNDKICIVGKNGKGKTTLLKLLSQELKPLTGEILYHPKAKKGYFAQTNVENLEPNRTVLEEIESEIAFKDNQAARNICGGMMFSGDAALKKISMLSGGEKARVMLGKILIKPRNILFLDEPTNHLDMQSTDSLLEAIDNYDGAVVMVTHNEMFLNAVADRLIVFRDGKVFEYNGSYNDYVNKVGWQEETKNKNEKKTIDKKTLRKMRADILTEKSNTLNPIYKTIETNEKEIEKIDSILVGLQDDIVKATEEGDGEKISLLSKDYHCYEANMSSLLEELENLYVEVEEKGKYFKEKLIEFS